MKQAQVRIENLKLDYDIYPRTQISDAHVTAMQEAVDAGAEMPPILVCSKSNRIIDGFHRYTRAHRNAEDTIAAILEDYPDEAAVFAAAVKANSAHGKPYSPYERAKIVRQAQDFGLEIDRLSDALNLTVDRITEIQAGFVGVGKTAAPVKATVSHLRGGRMTKEQSKAAEKLGGMPQRFYVEQLLILVENDLVNLADEAMMNKLQRLHEKLGDLLKTPGAARKAKRAV
jgi:ParB-like chromosome segregation protein Spo0J